MRPNEVLGASSSYSAFTLRNRISSNLRLSVVFVCVTVWCLWCLSAYPDAAPPSAARVTRVMEMSAPMTKEAVKGRRGNALTNHFIGFFHLPASYQYRYQRSVFQCQSIWIPLVKSR